MPMPFNSSTPVMYYNVDLFKKAGILLLSKSEPVTWDAMAEITAKQMTRRESTKISRGLRLGYFIQIRNIIIEELELVWNDSKPPREALDNAVKRSNIKLREFEETYK